MKDFNEMLNMALAPIRLQYKERSFNFLMSKQKVGNDIVYIPHNKLEVKYGQSIDKEFLN